MQLYCVVHSVTLNSGITKEYATVTKHYFMPMMANTKWTLSLKTVTDFYRVILIPCFQINSNELSVLKNWPNNVSAIFFLFFFWNLMLSAHAAIFFSVAVSLFIPLSITVHSMWSQPAIYSCHQVLTTKEHPETIFSYRYNPVSLIADVSRIKNNLYSRARRITLFNLNMKKYSTVETAYSHSCITLYSLKIVGNLPEYLKWKSQIFHKYLAQ